MFEGVRSQDDPMVIFDTIKKRDGRVVAFDSSKITAAIAKAGKATRRV